MSCCSGSLNGLLLSLCGVALDGSPFDETYRVRMASSKDHVVELPWYGRIGGHIQGLEDFVDLLQTISVARATTDFKQPPHLVEATPLSGCEDRQFSSKALV
jgi:hypothetical protein